jgi:hypothetical protein
MKQVLSWISKRFNAAILILFFVCLYAVLQIRLGCFWSLGEIENSDAVNSILEGLSYSFIAAYVFYLLSVIAPSLRRNKMLMPILKERVGNIRSLIRKILLEFSRQTPYGADVNNVSDTASILNSKNWDHVVPEILNYNQVSISYFSYINAIRVLINNSITDLIICYKDDLSEDQIVALEGFRKSPFFLTVSTLSTMPNITVNSGVNSLINEFVEMQKEYLKLEEMF